VRGGRTRVVSEVIDSTSDRREGRNNMYEHVKFVANWYTRRRGDTLDCPRSYRREMLTQGQPVSCSQLLFRTQPLCFRIADGSRCS
jgi:hypothetical protein